MRTDRRAQQHRRHRALGWCCSLALTSCSAVTVNQPTLTNRVDNVSLQGVELAPGASEHKVDVSGTQRRFGLWVPAQGATANHPVVLLLWGAQRHPNFRRALPCLLEPEIAKLNPIVIAPEAPRGRGGEWWRGEEASYALGLLRAAVMEWPVDDRKVVVMGYSNGGIGAWVFARAFPQYFSAAIPMAFNHTVVGDTHLPVFAIQGEKDELFGSGDVEQSIEAVRASGSNVTLAIRPKGSHFKPCDYQPELAAARQWLENTVWHQLDPMEPKSSLAR